MFSEFKSKSKAEWLAKVEKDLKGKPIAGLNWELYGETFSPFFHVDDLDNSPNTLSDGRVDNQWQIGELILVTDIKAANAQALFALERGANALCFQWEQTPSLADLETLLKEIQHEWISTHFILKQENWTEVVFNFIKSIEKKGQDPQKVACSFQFKGQLFSVSLDREYLQSATAQLPQARFLNVDVMTEKDAVKALTTALHQGNRYLSFLHDEDLDIKKWHHHIQFSIGLGDDYFLNMAMIRALKLTWQQVLQAWNADLVARSPIEVHLTKMHQTEDEHYNKIKATSQAMSAVIGGANRLYIYPSDAFKNTNGTSFSRRIALNVQHLMQQESYLDRVTDPAAGSYYIETLTNALAAKAWEKFQDL